MVWFRSLKKLFLYSSSVLSHYFTYLSFCSGAGFATNYHQPSPNQHFRQQQQQPTKWCVQQHTCVLPTDAHGTLEFQGTGEGDKAQVSMLLDKKKRES